MRQLEGYSQLKPDPLASSRQIDLLRDNIARLNYPGYPALKDRLVLDACSPEATVDGRLVLPDGPWEANTNKGRFDDENAPTEADQIKFTEMGLSLDSRGRPLHPWIHRMIADPTIGAVTGKGAYWKWGPNETADAIVIIRNSVLLIERYDTGDYSLPGGFLDKNEYPVHASIRELKEETNLTLPYSCRYIPVYEGPVADLRQTANAWPNNHAYLFIPNADELDLDSIRAGDDARTVAFFPVNEVLGNFALHGSHRYLLQRAVELMPLNLN